MPTRCSAKLPYLRSKNYGSNLNMTPQHMLTRRFFTELCSNENKIQKRDKFKNKISNYVFQYKTENKRKIKTH